MGDLGSVLNALKTIMVGMGIYTYVVGAVFLGLGFYGISIVTRALGGRR